MVGDSARERAESLLSHYIERAWCAGGLSWGTDNEAEVGAIVDAIIGAAREEIAGGER